MNPNDYDEDGNNIVPCPICNNVYCPSKDKEKCPEEADFVRAVELKTLQEESFDPTKLDMWTDLKIRLYNLGRIYDAESLSSQQEAIEQQIEEIIKFSLLSNEAKVRKECGEVFKGFIDNLRVEECPPFSEEIRGKVDIINQYLIPAVKKELYQKAFPSKP